MGADGAHENIGAESAMRYVVGGEEYQTMSDDEFERMVREAPLGPELDYNGGANATARLILEAYEKYPQTRELPEGHEYLKNAEGEVVWANPIYLNVDLYDVIKKLYPEHQEIFQDLTGFMWGWAVNAARKINGLGPIPNPAILTVEVSR